MKTSTAVLIVAGGAGVVWVASRGFLRTLADLGLGQAAIDSGLLSDDEVRQLIAFQPYLSTSQQIIGGATSGASAGAIAGPWGAAIGSAAGALYGWITSTRNETLKDRIEFAKRLGFSRQYCSKCNDGWSDDRAALEALFEALQRIGRQDLVDIALTVIGKSDYEGNQKWMFDVIRAFEAAGFRFNL